MVSGDTDHGYNLKKIMKTIGYIFLLCYAAMSYSQTTDPLVGHVWIYDNIPTAKIDGKIYRSYGKMTITGVSGAMSFTFLGAGKVLIKQNGTTQKSTWKRIDPNTITLAIFSDKFPLTVLKNDKDELVLVSKIIDEAIIKNLKVMDATALALCRDQKLPIKVFSIFKTGALMRVVLGEDEGTLVHA